MKDSIKRAAAVYRVSSADQTADNQVALAERMASRRGWEIVKTYDENEDGYQTGRAMIEDRPFILELIEAAKRGEFQVAIFKNPSRGSREVIEGLTIARALRNEGVLIAFSQSGDVLDWDNPMDQIVIMLGGWQADMDWSQIKANLAGGRKDCALLGSHGTGVAPYGYVRDPAAKKHGLLLVDPTAAEHVQFAFTRILAGDTIQDATKALTAHWSDFQGRRSDSKGFGRSTVSRWLRSLVYRGDDDGIQWITPAEEPSRLHKCRDFQKRGTKAMYCAACRDCKHQDTLLTPEDRPQCIACGRIAYPFTAPEIVSAEDYDLVQTLLGR